MDDRGCKAHGKRHVGRLPNPGLVAVVEKERPHIEVLYKNSVAGHLFLLTLLFPVCVFFILLIPERQTPCVNPLASLPASNIFPESLTPPPLSQPGTRIYSFHQIREALLSHLRMRKSSDIRETTTSLPSLSSSVSSVSSLSTATTPIPDHLHIHNHQHRQAQAPQRSASAGASMRHPQHHHFRHHSATATTTTTPLRPASWGNERAKSFHYFEDPSYHHHHQSLVSALLQQQQQQDRWDDSQLAMELAEDDLIDESVKRRTSARRIKQKLMKSISRQSFDGSMDLDTNATSTTTPPSSMTGAAIIPSSPGNRIARSFKRLTSMMF
ncbi:hypothetical protein BX666DRAFT_1985179 [Dichotomocladium elegans]|nr:hypothetical protein BX666DRAFT_1985179 [Dichotomocladium elegans]